MRRLKGWKDLTSMDSATKIDSFGHGTFMTRLRMEVAPIADVYLICVAEQTDDLQNNASSIAKVRFSNRFKDKLTFTIMQLSSPAWTRTGKLT